VSEIKTDTGGRESKKSQKKVMPSCLETIDRKAVSHIKHTYAAISGRGSENSMFRPDATTSILMAIENLQQKW
jgi:hypothetical protein